ncbi:3'-5' exonuclease [Porphyromonas pasteri]|uniref:3'-5' exonuclease n=1 Tax=Porphyromonas pasteri TaxID=1583331 RepID=UPI0036169746
MTTKTSPKSPSGKKTAKKPSSTSASKKRTAVETAAPQEKERPVRRSSTKPSAFAPVYSYPPSITDEELQSLALARCPAPITIIETREEARRVAMRLRRAGILGIDTETRPSFTAGVRYEVSLLQIATEEECFLFRLNKMGLPKSLISLLEDPAIIKVGLSLRDDITALSRREAFTPGSFVELQKLCGGYGIRELGLQKIYAILFAERMSKSQRMSDWEAKKLSPAQAHYAALDAWASLRIYTTLMALPAPSPTQFALI